MNNNITKIILSYFIKLPEAIQDFIIDSAWQERTDEIAKKYSLNNTQTENLINNVLFVLIGLEKPEDFLEKIIVELGISRLLADQMMEDLEVRVFEYAVKSIEKDIENKGDIQNLESINKKPVEEKSRETENDIQKQNQEIFIEKKPETLPEEKPNILPMIDEEKTAHDVPVETTPTTEEKIQEPYRNNAQDTEQAQRPVSVPRYTASPETPPSTTQETAKKYVVDPYREPIE